MGKIDPQMNDAASASAALSWEPAGTLHHTGFVVESIADTASQFAAVLGFDCDRKIISDPLPASRLSFLTSKVGGGPLFELVEPLAKDSPVSNFLQRTVVCIEYVFQVKDLGELVHLIAKARTLRLYGRGKKIQTWWTKWRSSKGCNACANSSQPKVIEKSPIVVPTRLAIVVATCRHIRSKRLRDLLFVLTFFTERPLHLPSNCMFDQPGSQHWSA